MILVFLFVVMVQGGDLGVLGFSTMEECQEGRLEAMKLPDVLAITECRQDTLARTSVTSKVGL